MWDKQNKAKHHFIGINIPQEKSDVLIVFSVVLNFSAEALVPAQLKKMA